MSDWFLYIVRCRNGSLYTGITTDVERRFEEHSSNNGARYLRGKGPLRLEFHCLIGDKGDALRIEHAVKQLDKKLKESLISDSTTDATTLLALLPEKD